MSRELDVHMLPKLLDPRELSGGVAVMIDVLRASTTISHALFAGAQTILPCQDVSQARTQAAGLPSAQTLLGGERDGKLIDGFDLDNSPSAYTRDLVGGKTVVFTTTNGTRALLKSEQADRVLIGSFVNMKALVGMLTDDDRAIHLVCAGTGEKISSEDVLCAGAIAAGFETAAGPFESADDQAQMAMTFYRAHAKNQTTLYSAMCASLGGRNLQQLGFEKDIRIAATWDLFDIVPEYFPQTRSITTALKEKSKR